MKILVKTMKEQSILVVLCFHILVSGKEFNEPESIQISLLPESESTLNVSDSEKPILRYGFHKVSDCNNFQKAFICVRKCLDLGYQVAHANKNCICTCYKNEMLAQYKSIPSGSEVTRWKLGAPTTQIPAWAGGADVSGKLNSNEEINANYTEYVEDFTKTLNGESKDTSFTGPDDAAIDHNQLSDVVTNSSGDSNTGDATGGTGADAEITTAEGGKGDEGTEATPVDEETPTPAEEIPAPSE